MKTNKKSNATFTSHITDGERSLSDSMKVHGGGTEFDLDREAGKLFAEIIKRRSKDPSAGVPSQNSQSNYKAFRTSVFHDPEYNPTLKNVHNVSSLDMAKDNEKNWYSSGATWSRMPRFPKRYGGGPQGLEGSIGDGLGKERFVAQERFYNTDYGRKQTLYKGVCTSQWGISQGSKSKKFEEYQRQHKTQTSTDLGPGTYLSNQPWKPKEVCGEVPQSAIFCSTSGRDLFTASSGFRVINDDKEYKRRTRKELKSQSNLRANSLYDPSSYGHSRTHSPGASTSGGPVEHYSSAPAIMRPHTTYGDQHFFENTIYEEEDRAQSQQSLAPGTWHGRPSYLNRKEDSRKQSQRSYPSITSLNSYRSTRSQTSLSPSLKGGNTFSRASRKTFADESLTKHQEYSKSYVRVPSTQSMTGGMGRHERQPSGAIDLSRSASLYPQRSTDTIAQGASLGSLHVEEQDSLLMLRATTAPVHSHYEQVL